MEICNVVSSNSVILFAEEESSYKNLKNSF